MARGITFVPSDSTDVVAYRVRLTLDSFDEAVDYPVSDLSVGSDGKVSIDMSTDPQWEGLDGTYAVEIRAIDDAGNPSSPLAGSLSIDFVAPNPPTDFGTF